MRPLDARQRDLCGALSGLLSYPGPETRPLARAALKLATNGPAETPIACFAKMAERLADVALEELYTSTFDLQATCVPYVGHHLLGDDPRRGPFLAKLVELFEAAHYKQGPELPDHLREILACLSMAPPCQDLDDLVDEALVPALEKMTQSLQVAGNPYANLLLAAQAIFVRAESEVPS